MEKETLNQACGRVFKQLKIPQEIKEKIIKILAKFASSSDYLPEMTEPEVNELADQILELVSQRDKEVLGEIEEKLKIILMKYGQFGDGGLTEAIEKLRQHLQKVGQKELK